MWDAIEAIDEWLDREVAEEYKDQPLAQHWGRTAKVAEECGEAIAALIGASGQNPRKGICNTYQDVVEELADVAITALCAIQHFTGDIDMTVDTVENKLTRIIERASIQMKETA
jgi:NTP pyrophosphatase (non-canonical NTP hydrolase)